MRKIYLVGVMLLLSITSVLATDGGRVLTTSLTGAEEVSSSGVVGVGDPDGAGFARISLNQGRGEVCFAIEVTNVDEPITRAHIHAAPAGANGGVGVALVEPGVTPFTFSDGFAAGCVSASLDLIKAIRKSPEGYYVNVHNTTYPAGAVRGQLGD